MAEGGDLLPKMMLAFIVRRCAVDLGHSPSAAEFAEWANNHGLNGKPYCLFGRAITEREAQVILKHQSRLVSAKSASEQEKHVEAAETDPPPSNPKVVSLAKARARRQRPNGSRRP